MRPLTPFVSYFDNAGNLLVGRVRFYGADGTTPAEVFEKDGTTLGSSVFTDSSGRLVQQPFLADHDYTIYFDLYIGHATMTEDDDPESWEEQGSAVERYNTLGVSLDAEGVRSIGTVTELRQSPGLKVGEIVTLMGYNSPGDKEPICYRWAEHSTKFDNGGSVIKVNDVPLGRWEIVECPRQLDVRHFGAFPLQVVATDTMQRYRIEAAGLYAHNNGCGLYFPSDDMAAFYDISGLVLFDVDGDDGARVFASSGSEGTAITGIRSIHCASGESCEGTITLIDEVLRTSFEGDSGYVDLSPTKRLVIDSEVKKFIERYSGIEVEVLTYSNIGQSHYVRLENCRVISNKKIDGHIILQGCTIDTGWFSDDYDFASDLTSIDNNILLRNCKDADTYILLKNKQNESDYGDLGEQTVHSDVLAGCVIENCKGSVNVIDNGGSIERGTIELHNVNLWISGLGASDGINAVDAWIILPSALTLKNLSVKRGAIVYGGTVPNGTLVLDEDSSIDDAEIEMSLYSRGAYLTVTNSVIKAPISGDRIDLMNNQVYSNVTQYDDDGVVYVKCVGNTFKLSANNSPARHIVSSFTAGAIVSGEWRGNGSTYNTVHWIDVVRTNLDPDDWKHRYSYVGNSEPYLSKYSGANYRMQFKGYRGNRSDGRGVFATDVPFVFWYEVSNAVYVVNRDVSWKMFTVGSRNTRRNARLDSNMKNFQYGSSSPAIGAPPLLNYGPSRDGVLPAVCTGGYDWTFEEPGTVHSDVDSNGVNIGYFFTPPPTTDNYWFAEYPTTPTYTISLSIFIDKDFECDGQDVHVVGVKGS